MHSTRNENPISLASPSVLKSFFLASRPKTWSASACPVFIGTAFAAKEGPIEGIVFILTLLFSLFIQIGANYANDYFDFLKGADTAARAGPKRAVQQGWISPQSMRSATGLVFILAVIVALPLLLASGLWSFLAAAICVLSGVLYTGGPKPLGYLGLGELLVFIFFGPVAVLGTYFLQRGEVNRTVCLASLGPGCLSTAILIVNNLRDAATDCIAKKKTIVVRFGAAFGRTLYMLTICIAALLPVFLVGSVKTNAIFSASFILLLFAPWAQVLRSDYQPALQRTSTALLLYTLCFCWALLWV